MVERLKRGAGTYSLLGQLTRTLVFAIAEEFDDTTLVWCETGKASELAIDSLILQNFLFLKPRSFVLPKAHAVQRSIPWWRVAVRLLRFPEFPDMHLALSAAFWGLVV